MRNAVKVGALLLAMTTGAAMAEDKKPMTTQQAMAYAKKMDAQDRALMMDQAKQLQAQINQLQASLQALMKELEKTPKYFDEVPKTSSNG